MVTWLSNFDTTFPSITDMLFKTSCPSNFCLLVVAHNVFGWQSKNSHNQGGLYWSFEYNHIVKSCSNFLFLTCSCLKYNGSIIVFQIYSFFARWPKTYLDVKFWSFLAWIEEMAMFQCSCFQVSPDIYVTYLALDIIFTHMYYSCTSTLLSGLCAFKVLAFNTWSADADADHASEI